MDADNYNYHNLTKRYDAGESPRFYWAKVGQFIGQDGRRFCQMIIGGGKGLEIGAKLLDKFISVYEIKGDGTHCALVDLPLTYAPGFQHRVESTACRIVKGLELLRKKEEEPVILPPCASCNSKGWGIYSTDRGTHEIQRCQDCQRMHTDEEAAEAAAKFIADKA